MKNVLRSASSLALLLSLAAQRLEIAHDPAGARRAYALAAGVLDGLDDHRLLNLKQALAQERVAVDALGAGARADAFARLDSLADAIAGLPRQAPAAAPGQVRPAWQRWLAPSIPRPHRQRSYSQPKSKTGSGSSTRTRPQRCCKRPRWLTGRSPDEDPLLHRALHASLPQPGTRRLVHDGMGRCTAISQVLQT